MRLPSHTNPTEALDEHRENGAHCRAERPTAPAAHRGKDNEDAGCRFHGPAGVRAALQAVATLTKFTADNDPYGKRDFGWVTANGQSLFWKIDYDDETLSHQAVDPADEHACTRVLTIMLTEEY